jgi:hypothetical protein
MKPWQSKTHWTALVLAILAFIPGVGEWVTEHPQASVFIQSVIMVVLRWLTNSPVTLSR